jgi:hypothetical protein
MKKRQTRTAVPVLIGRVRREIAFLKAVLRDNGIALPGWLITLLATKLPERIHAFDRRRLQLLRRQERELRVLRDKTCLPKASYAPRIKSKPMPYSTVLRRGTPKPRKKGLMALAVPKSQQTSH